MTDLERIFSDAKVVDIDLSEWDNFISLWILSDHYNDYSGRVPLLRVSFHGMKSMKIEFNNEGVKLLNGQHCQWNTCELEYSENDESKKLLINGDKPSPHISIECKDIDVKEMDHKILDRTFPGWDKPYSGLVRPNPEVIYNNKL